MADETPTRSRAEPPNLAEAVGGPLGMLETALPAVAFIAAYSVSGQDTDIAAIVAVGLALVLAVARLVRRESPRHALSGLAGGGVRGASSRRAAGGRRTSSCPACWPTRRTRRPS